MYKWVGLTVIGLLLMACQQQRVAPPTPIKAVAAPPTISADGITIIPYAQDEIKRQKLP